MSIKAVFLGGIGVGKSSIIRRFSEGNIDNFHRATVSAAFVQKDIEFEGKKFEFGIWDTAGAEQFRAITPIYFRSANIAFIVADASDSVSDADAEWWAREVMSKADEGVVIIFVMNKMDLIQDDQKSVETRAQKLSANYGEHYCLTSALQGTGITELFAFAFNLIPDAIRKAGSDPVRHVDIEKPNEDGNETKKNGCSC
ncbi:Ras-related protein RABH1a [Tritrichomonas foetus]|uniref:Ras-related protein RABH1a n=1 Tax=Tritrichomonas foetus TaxID=1144522 RepID=A0A1J4L2G7_9EUKA|nr:Ras-related protein RABH1a [Tritrichomonas foetus]|eukprot:OHT17610.1 Ras-related protein RABH1a [Tritrichomonas foetus]